MRISRVLLHVIGPLNIQFIAKDQEIKVIEANVRASRSFPFVSKALDVNMIELATKAMMDLPFTPYPNADMPPPDYVCVKVPQFSFSRLQGADPILVCHSLFYSFLVFLFGVILKYSNVIHTMLYFPSFPRSLSIHLLGS